MQIQLPCEKKNDPLRNIVDGWSVQLLASVDFLVFLDGKLIPVVFIDYDLQTRRFSVTGMRD